MIKNIQIRSFIKGGNHGQYLQALGLKALVESIIPTANVSHLDYENHFWKELKAQIRSGHLLKFIAMRHFWNKNIKFTEFNENCDLSIYGSDMIWHLGSPLFPADKKLFGENDNSKYKISYAPSVGHRNEPEPIWPREYLNLFHKLGVRDNQTKQFVLDHSGCMPELVIDPCFHLIGTKYLKDNSDIVVRSNYISIYSPMTKRLSNKFKRTLKEQGNIFDYKFFGYYERKSFLFEWMNQIKDPLDVVNGIAKSKFLITTTFHGVMMALMTKTPFVVIKSPNLVARLDSPISNVFSDKRVLSESEFNDLSERDIADLFCDGDLDWEYLSKYLKESRDWLANSLATIK